MFEDLHFFKTTLIRLLIYYPSYGGTQRKKTEKKITCFFKVRKYARKTEQGPAPDIRKAVEHYCTSNDGITRTAELFGVARSTVRDHNFQEAELRWGLGLFPLCERTGSNEIVVFYILDPSILINLKQFDIKRLYHVPYAFMSYARMSGRTYPGP